MGVNFCLFFQNVQYQGKALHGNKIHDVSLRVFHRLGNLTTTKKKFHSFSQIFEF